jgi:hypothetical protein
MLSGEVILPAVGADRNADQPGHNLGHTPYGGLLAIPRGVDLDRLDLTEAGRRLAEAVRDYGIYVVDGEAATTAPCERTKISSVRPSRTFGRTFRSSTGPFVC